MIKNKRILKLVRKLAALSFVNGKIINNSVDRSLNLIKSLPQNEAIYALSEYLIHLKRVGAENSIVIESRNKLMEDQIREVSSSFRSFSKNGLVNTKTNPSILGGVRVTIGDMVYDATINGKIKSLKQAIIGLA